MGIGAGTVAIASLALAAVGTAASVYGQIEAGNAAKSNANYQAEVARNNQTIAQQNATYATEAGQAKAQAASLRGAAQQGKVRAAIAAGGIDPNSGSALEVQTSQKEISALDTLTEMQNAQLQAYGYRAQSTDFAAQAQLDRAKGSQAQLAGDIGAAGTLAGNASSLGLKWSGMQNPASGGPSTSSDVFQTGNFAASDI